MAGTQGHWGHTEGRGGEAWVLPPLYPSAHPITALTTELIMSQCPVPDSERPRAGMLSGF